MPVGMLGDEPGRMGALAADQRTAGPAHPVDECAQPRGVGVIHGYDACLVLGRAGEGAARGLIELAPAQWASGYNWRALTEVDIGRYKRAIGDALGSRTEGRQTTEVAIAVALLNRMLALGRPEYVRLT
jgi:hypothetical protein